MCMRFEEKLYLQGKLLKSANFRKLFDMIDNSESNYNLLHLLMLLARNPVDCDYLGQVNLVKKPVSWNDIVSSEPLEGEHWMQNYDSDESMEEQQEFTFVQKPENNFSIVDFPVSFIHFGSSKNSPLREVLVCAFGIKFQPNFPVEWPLQYKRAMGDLLDRIAKLDDYLNSASLNETEVLFKKCILENVNMEKNSMLNRELELTESGPSLLEFSKMFSGLDSLCLFVLENIPFNCSSDILEKVHRSLKSKLVPTNYTAFLDILEHHLQLDIVKFLSSGICESSDYFKGSNITSFEEFSQSMPLYMEEKSRQYFALYTIIKSIRLLNPNEILVLDTLNLQSCISDASRRLCHYLKIHSTVLQLNSWIENAFFDLDFELANISIISPFDLIITTESLENLIFVRKYLRTLSEEWKSSILSRKESFDLIKFRKNRFLNTFVAFAFSLVIPSELQLFLKSFSSASSVEELRACYLTLSHNLLSSLFLHSNVNSIFIFRLKLLERILMI